MNKDHDIYELTDEMKKMFVSEPTNQDQEAKKKFDELREDVARLDGYLKGRADEVLRGKGSNKDLAG